MRKYVIVFILFIVVIIAAWMHYPNLHPVPKQPTMPTKTVLGTVDYACNDGKAIHAVLYDGAAQPAPNPGQPPIPGGSADVKLSDGRSMTLNQTISADGARYANADESFVFWSKGNGALVLENNKEQTYTGCLMIKPQPDGSDLTKTYSNGTLGISLRLADGFTTDEKFVDQQAPDLNINGVKFTIPAAMADGTNLAHDSYISVEYLPKAKTCSADQFLYGVNQKPQTTRDGDTTYSYMTFNDAGAGNRYDNSVYALPGTNPCIAMHYFIHYNVFENYPAGTVKEFDEQAVVKEFDAIRRTLVVNQ